VNGFTGEAYISLSQLTIKSVRGHTNDDSVMVTNAACIHILSDAASEEYIFNLFRDN
jgi:hypothetical protein